MKNFALITVPKLEEMSQEQIHDIQELLGMPVLFLERGMELHIGDEALEEVIRVKETIDNFLIN